MAPHDRGAGHPADGLSQHRAEKESQETQDELCGQTTVSGLDLLERPVVENSHRVDGEGDTFSHDPEAALLEARDLPSLQILRKHLVVGQPGDDGESEDRAADEHEEC